MTTMENFKLENDIQLFCIKADSFPDGIEAAHEKLISISFGRKRNHFGVSFLNDEEILYMAGEEVKKGDKAPDSTNTYTLRKGNYISFYVKDFAKNISEIEKAFQILTDDPRIDPKGCCVECYLPEGSNLKTAKDVRCMVRLAD